MSRVRAERDRANGQEAAAQAPVRAAQAPGASVRRNRSTRSAPALSIGAFPLPHFGDSTHRGQPAEHRHEAIASYVAPTHRVAASNPRSAKPAPPG